MKRLNLPKDLEDGIDDIREEFREDPTEYLVESSIQYELVNILKDYYGENLDADVSIKNNPPKYKKEYVNSFKGDNSINRVKAEVNIGKGSGKTDELIDICIFDGEDQVKIKYDEGSKYFDEEEERGLHTAIEVKYVKNDNLPGSVWENPEKRRKENAELPQSPEDIEDTTKQFFKDIQKLSNLNAENKILLIFSNKNIFQQPDNKDEKWTEQGKDQENNRKAVRRLENLKKVLGDDIALREVHLGKTSKLK
jgi:hypothetical protein